MEKSQFSLVDKTDRGILGEGRNYYMGFGFGKRTTNTINMVTPISPCKDYLNDVIWTEHSNKCISAYGLKYQKNELFTKNKFGYLVIGILNSKYGGKYDNYERDFKMLNEKYLTIENFMNQIEAMIPGCDQKTRMFFLEENRILLKVPMFWCQATYLISLYSLLVRVGLFYEQGDVLNFLENFKAFEPDMYLVNSAVPKLKKIMQGNVPVQDFTEDLGHSTIHNLGIVGFNKF